MPLSRIFSVDLDRSSSSAAEDEVGVEVLLREAARGLAVGERVGDDPAAPSAASSGERR